MIRDEINDTIAEPIIPTLLVTAYEIIILFSFS